MQLYFNNNEEELSEKVKIDTTTLPAPLEAEDAYRAAREGFREAFKAYLDSLSPELQERVREVKNKP
jgi:hypothetical protein